MVRIEALLANLNFMHKNLFIFFFSFLLLPPTEAQERCWGIALEYRSKTDCYAPDYGEKTWLKADGPIYAFSAHYRKERFFIEVGYHREIFTLGWRQPHLGSYQSTEPYRMFPFRLGYYWPLLKVWKRPVVLTPAVGVVLGRAARAAEQVNVPFFWDIVLGADTIHVSDYNVSTSTSFMLWEARLQVQYALFGHVSIFGGVGYTAGHDTVASARIGYAVNSEPPISIHSSTQGGTYFWQAGLKLQVPVRNRARDK